MAEDIKLRLGMRQNLNQTHKGYMKYYPEVVLRQQLDFRGFVEHMIGHGLAYPRHIIEAVTAQVMSCLPELVFQGVGVKLDGLGAFYPTIKCKPADKTKSGHERYPGAADNIAYLIAHPNPLHYIQGVAMRFRPEANKYDNITGKELKKRASFESYGVYAKFNQDGTPSEDLVLVPYDKWKAAVNAEPEEP